MNARVRVLPFSGLLPAAALSGAWIAAWLLAARGGVALSPTVLLVAVAVCAWLWGARAAWLATVLAALACAGSSAALSGGDQRALETAILAAVGALIGTLPRKPGSDRGDDPGDPVRASALAAIVESSDDAIVGRDLDGIVTSWNPGAEAMFGYSAADMLGGTILRLVPPELQAEEADHRRRIVHGERLRHFETVRVRKDGSRFDVSITASAIRDTRGRVVGTSNVARDITERKRAEARVIASESSLALAQSLAHLGSWDFDLVRRTGTWSHEMYRLFHLDPAQGESAFDPFVRLVHPDDRAAIARIETDIALNTAPRRVDYRTNPALGPMRYISALLHVEHDAAGNAVRSTGVAMDVTEAREAELASQSERRFSDTMIESALGILYFYSESGRFLRWNRNFERVTGYAADTIAHMSPLDFFPPAERDIAAARIADVFANGSATLEASLQARDGSCVPYLFTGRRVELDGVPCLVGMGIDMSESKRMLHLLQASQASLARAQRIAHLGSWEVDIATSRLLWSDEVHRIAGTAPREQRLRPEDFLDIVHPDDVAQVRAALRDALAGVAPLDLEHRIVRPDGALRWVHQVGELQRDDEGRPSVLAGTVLDITGRKTADQQLRAAYDSLEHKVSERTAQLLEARVRAEAADRLKSAFLATMSHELRTPLNSIIGFTSIVLQGMAGPLNAEQTRQLGMVRTSARHLLELINDVLDLSRIEAGQLDLQQQPFDVRASIEHAVAVAEPLAAAKALSLSATVAPDVGEVIGDRRRVEQILINLLGNAVKFTEKGHIALVAELEPGDDGQPPTMLRLTVADTGIGIKPDDIATLFQPFQQIDIGLARRHEGTGLGLAICRRLAHLMGGRIFVESRWGQGSRFSVDVPLRGAGAPP